MNNHPSNSKQDLDDVNLDLLLRRSPVVTASDQFVDKVILAVQQPQEAAASSNTISQLLTKRLHNNRFILIGTLAAALVISCIMLFSTTPKPAYPSLTDQNASSDEHSEELAADSFAELQRVADQEVLLAATEHLNAFSDSELASLMGF